MNKWIFLRIASLAIACIASLLLSHDQGMRNTKFENSSFVLVGGFTYFVSLFANIFIRIPLVFSAQEVNRPSWRAPIIGTAQTLDFLGWFILILGASAGVYLIFIAPDYIRLGIFFFSVGAGILSGNWSYQFFREHK